MVSDARVATKQLIDGYGRHISYVRLSVTDRCDLRCQYCMAEKMQFLPRADILTFEEIEFLADLLIARGVKRIRLTGGEPLVRRDIADLVARLGRKIGHGLDELTMTTNATQLARFTPAMAAAGIRRINVSLDSLDANRFREITRRGDLGQVLDGIKAASAAGIAIKINMVALKGFNDDEIERMARWCGGEGHGLTLIETMPLGEVAERRTTRYVPLDAVLRDLSERFELIPSTRRTGGPARYYEVPALGLSLGVITPLTNNFCAGCNRIRIAATGTIYGCLGHDQKVELRELLRSGGRMAVDAALDLLLAGKPQRHDFDIAAATPAVARHMSVTGG
ncbi:MAG: GTP 3',8-cyclase MoaA [Sphingomicrobium sp.]